MSARERREVPGAPGWELDSGECMNDGCMTIWRDGWVVCEVHAMGSDPPWRSTRPHEPVPAAVLEALPKGAADAVRRKAES